MSDPTTFRVVGIDVVRESAEVREVTTHLVWEWRENDEPRIAHLVLDPLASAAVGEALSQALPIRAAGETDEQMVTRVLTRGALSDPISEERFSRELGARLIPGEVRRALLRAHGRGRARVRLLPAQSLAQVPWELLVIDDINASGQRRLVEFADLVYDVSDGIHEQRSQKPRAWAAEDSTTF